MQCELFPCQKVCTQITEMWCNTDKVQRKTDVSRQTQRVICKDREEGTNGKKQKQR